MNTKFLLTANGITNKSIENALLSLAWGSFSDKNFLFVSTAQNPKISDKSRIINNLIEFKNLWFKNIDIIDITIPDIQIIEEKIIKSDIICFSGWNTVYLKTKLHKSWILQNFEKFFDGKIIVGISAWSIVWGKNIKGKSDIQKLEDLGVQEIYNGDDYNLFDFIFIPHFNRVDFPHHSENALNEIAKIRKEHIYALDDNCTLLNWWREERNYFWRILQNL